MNRKGEEEMRDNADDNKKGRMRIVRFTTLVAGTGLFAMMLGIIGCATTQQEQPNIISKAQGAQNPVPLFSGLFPIYTLLQPGGEGQALYGYINPSVNWSQYNAVTIDPVTFWGAQDSSVSPKDQEFLSQYFYNKLREDLIKNLSVVDEPGPGIMRL